MVTDNVHYVFITISLWQTDNSSRSLWHIISQIQLALCPLKLPSTDTSVAHICATAATLQTDPPNWLVGSVSVEHLRAPKGLFLFHTDLSGLHESRSASTPLSLSHLQPNKQRRRTFIHNCDYFSLWVIAQPHGSSILSPSQAYPNRLAQSWDKCMWELSCYRTK